MTTKHTPGPWEVNRCDGELSIHQKESAKYIAEIGNSEDDNAEQDARLIAAAPELLEACRMVMEGLENDVINYPDGKFPSAERFTNRANRLRAAIAKAEGKI